MSIRTTACPLDCPDACSVRVELDDEQRPVRLDGADGPGTNPLTEGWICAKVRRFDERHHSPERITTPLIRVGAKGEARFREASWDEAIGWAAEQISDALDRFGPGSIVPYLYNSSSGALAADALTPALFRSLGCAEVEPTICAHNTARAWRLVYPGLPPSDPAELARSRTIVVWGANPAVSQPHLTPVLTRARRAGARLVVIDPRRTATAARADVHLAPRPGTDLPLALALADELARGELIDRDFCSRHVSGLGEYLAAAAEWPAERAAVECGIEVEQIRALARLLAEGGPVAFRPGWGPERTRNGGNAWRAILALPALLGAFGQPGSGVHVSTGSASGLDVSAAVEHLGAPRPAPARTLPMHRVGRWLTEDDSVRVLVVQGANPAVTAPDQARVMAGLGRESLFTLVHEQVMTDTARWADLVLPAPTHLEVDDVAVAYGVAGYEPVRAVTPRVGQGRTNDEMAATLAQALGLGGFDPDPARLMASLGVDPDAGRVSPELGRQFVDAFPEGGRARLVADEPGVDRVPVYRPVEQADDELRLISPASPRSVTSMLADLDARPAQLGLSPADADRRGLAEGDRAVVTGAGARLELAVHRDASLPEGTAMIPKGLWLRHTDGVSTSNAFCPDETSDLGGACFNDARVRVSPA